MTQEANDSAHSSLPAVDRVQQRLGRRHRDNWWADGGHTTREHDREDGRARESIFLGTLRHERQTPRGADLAPEPPSPPSALVSISQPEYCSRYARSGKAPAAAWDDVPSPAGAGGSVYHLYEARMQ